MFYVYMPVTLVFYVIDPDIIVLHDASLHFIQMVRCNRPRLAGYLQSEGYSSLKTCV